MWPLPELSQMPTQPLSPDTHEDCDSALAPDKVSPAEVKDIKMIFESFLTIMPTAILLDLGH